MKSKKNIINRSYEDFTYASDDEKIKFISKSLLNLKEKEFFYIELENHTLIFHYEFNRKSKRYNFFENTGRFEFTSISGFHTLEDLSRICSKRIISILETFEKVEIEN